MDSPSKVKNVQNLMHPLERQQTSQSIRTSPLKKDTQFQINQNNNNNNIQISQYQQNSLTSDKYSKTQQQFFRADRDDYGFVPYLSERDRLGNLILPQQEKEKREQLKKSQQNKFQIRSISQSQQNFRKQKLKDRYNLNLVKNNSSHFSKPATATDLQIPSQNSLQTEFYDKQKHKKLIEKQKKQQNKNPNSLLSAIVPSQQSYCEDKSNISNYEKTKSVWDNLDTQYNKIDYNQKNAWVNNLFVSDMANIPGTNRIIQQKLNPKLDSSAISDQQTSQNFFTTQPQTSYSTRRKLIHKPSQPCIGYYSKTDNVFKYKSQPKYTFKKDEGIEKIKQSICVKDYYDINEKMLKNKEQRIYVADLETGSNDRFNIKPQGHSIKNRKKTEIDPQEIDDKMEFLRQMSKKYSLGTYTAPANYRLSWDISKRPTMEDMLTAWNCKIQGYGIQLGRKGINKMFNNTNMEIRNKDKKRK